MMSWAHMAHRPIWKWKPQSSDYLPGDQKLIAPLAFFMGMPFPLGLARVSQRAPELVPWAWAANGCASLKVAP